MKTKMDLYHLGSSLINMMNCKYTLLQQKHYNISLLIDSSICLQRFVMPQNIYKSVFVSTVQAMCVIYVSFFNLHSGDIEGTFEQFLIFEHSNLNFKQRQCYPISA